MTLARWPRAKTLGLSAAAIAALLGAGAAHAQPWLHADQPGAVHLITRTVEASQGGNGGSSGTSTDRDTLVERVIAVRDDGLELEYNLPKEDGDGGDVSNWQFPARVFKPVDGPMRLLNVPELEARLDRWLTEAKIPRSACGHYYFTWNVFRIECDPQTVLQTVAAYDLRPGPLDDGATYADPEASAPVTLAVRPGRHGPIFSGAAPIDAERVRRERAEAAVAVGEVNREPVTLEDALRRTSAETVSGTVTVTLEADADGVVGRRIRVTRIEVRTPDGRTETREAEETVERRPAPGQ